MLQSELLDCDLLVVTTLPDGLPRGLFWLDLGKERDGSTLALRQLRERHVLEQETLA